MFENVTLTPVRSVAMRSLAALAIGLAPAAAPAQTATGYPAKPLRLIVPFAAGGATDILARLAAAQLSQDLGRNVVVENRAGAGGNIGMEALARAAPDGYTIGIGAGATMAVNPNLYSSLPFDAARDFAPVHMLATVPHVLIINNAIPANDLRELIAHMKANPGKFSYGSPGSGTTGNLYGELFKKTAGVEMTHIPYKGGNQVRRELMAGTLQLTISTLVDAQAQIHSGAVRAIAVVSPRRASGLPSVPTFAELGMTGFDSNNWFGVVAPALVPREIVLVLNARIAAALASPEFRARLAPTGFEAAPAQTPEEFARFIASDREKWRRVVRELGARPD